MTAGSGVPETQTPIDPADLITDDDLDCLDTLKADGTMSASDLYVLAPRLRARWVAEALEEIVQVSVLTGGDLQSFTSGQKCMIRRRAAEYRADRR